MYAGRIVERGPARAIYATPRHPYTLGLLNSVPRLDSDQKQKLVPIEGQPPDLGSLGDGCSFYPRCSFRDDGCLESIPQLVEVGPAQWAACFKHETVTRATA